MFPKMLVHTELLDFSAVLLTQLSNTMLIQFEQTVCNTVSLLCHSHNWYRKEINNKYFKYSI